MKVDLIVPTVPGREESLERCLDSFGANPIVVEGATSCGAGWLQGLKYSGADYIVLGCDDIEAEEGWFAPAKEAIDRGMLPAPVIHRPDGSLESAGGDMTASACLLSEIQADWTPVGFTPLPIVGREQIERIGLIPIHYGCDVWVSHRGRHLGYDTVLRQDYKLIHHHEDAGRLEPHAGEIQELNRALADAA